MGNVRVQERTWLEWFGESGKTFAGWAWGAVRGAVRDHGAGPTLVAVAVLAAVIVAVVAYLLRERYDDEYGRHTDEREVGRPVKRLRNPGLSKHLVRVPYVVWWPLFGALYAGVHVLLVATTGMGKSKALLFWSLAYHVMHWCQGKLVRHLIVYDPKAEFLWFLMPLYNRFGWRYLVYSALPEHPASAALNIVADRAMAEVAALAMWPEAKGQEGHFNLKAREVFLAACEVTGYRGLWAVYELVRDAEALEASSERYPLLKRAYLQIQERERSSVLSTVTGVLSQLENPLVARMFSPDADTEQPDCSSWETPCSSHACIDWEQGQGMAALSSALQEVLHHVGLRAGNPNKGEERGPGTYAYLDEATSGGLRARKVMSYFGAGRGSRVYTLVVSQDVEQGYEVVGRSAYRSAAANAHIKVFGQTDDPETQAYASTQSGKTVLRLPPEETARPPLLLGGGEQRQAKPTAVKKVLRESLLPHHLQELEWAEFAVVSRPPRPRWHRHLPRFLRRRLGKPRKVEVVQSVSVDDYEDRIVPMEARHEGWAMHGVPRAQREGLRERLLARDPSVWESEWVGREHKRAAEEELAGGRSADLPEGSQASLVPGPDPGPEPAGRRGAQALPPKGRVRLLVRHAGLLLGRILPAPPKKRRKKTKKRGFFASLRKKRKGNGIRLFPPPKKKRKKGGTPGSLTSRAPSERGSSSGCETFARQEPPPRIECQYCGEFNGAGAGACEVCGDELSGGRSQHVDRKTRENSF